MNELQAIQPEQLTMEIVKKHICAAATDQEIFLFLQIAKSCKLNPFLNQIYLVKYGDQKAQILTSYNVYLQRAERSGAYAGLETTTVGSVDANDLKAIVRVYRKDWERPLIHEVYYAEYVQKKKDGSINRFWAEKPRTMIVKVAISQAFRLAFPLDFEGMPYTQDEINTVEVEQKPVLTEPKALEKPPQDTPKVPQDAQGSTITTKTMIDPADVKIDKDIKNIAKKHFKTPDDFQLWLIDNNLPESLKASTYVQKEQILEALEVFSKPKQKE